MVSFLSAHLSNRQKRRLYRFFLILDDIDFGYLRPVSLGTLFCCLIYIGNMMAPYRELLTAAQVYLFFLLLAIVAGAFIYFLVPYIWKIRAKIRVKMYRRKKRATFTLFV